MSQDDPQGRYLRIYPAPGVVGNEPVAGRRRARARTLLGLGLMIALSFAALVWGDGLKRRELLRIVVSPSRGSLNVQIQTSGQSAPGLSTSTLTKPDRLAVDLQGVSLASGFAAPRFKQAAGVKGIHISEVTGDSPATRIEFELTKPVARMYYRVQPLSSSGVVLIRLRPRPTKTRRHPAPTRPVTVATRPAPPTARRPAPPAPPPTPPAAKPTPKPTPPVSRASQPAPTATSPRPSGGLPIYLTVILAALVGALVTALGWRISLLLRRPRGRRAWLKGILATDDRIELRRALRTAGAWSQTELWTVSDLLVEVARDPGHPAAQAAADLIRSCFPVEMLMSQVTRGRFARRSRAVELLSLHDGDRVADLLLEVAATAPSLYREAVRALAQLLCTQPVRPVLQGLSGPSPARRQAAREAVQEAGPRSRPALRTALADPDQGIRAQAIEALVLIGMEGSVPAIAQLLTDPTEPVRAAAAQALGTLGVDGGVSASLLAALLDPSLRVREEAGIALARIGGEGLGYLVATLDRLACEDLNYRPSERLLNTLATQAETPLFALERALCSFNRGFAGDLAQALERAGRFDAWLAGMAEAAPETRAAVVSILRAAARAGMIDPALRGLDAPDIAVREACTRLLGEATDASSAQWLVPILSRPEEALRLAAVEALGRVGGAEAMQALTEALSDPAPSVRELAAAGLSGALTAAKRDPATEEGARLAIEAIVRATRDPSSAVRQAAAQVLGSASADDAVHVLVEVALHDEEDSVRTVAMQAIDRIGNCETLPILLVEALNSNEAALRAHALEILARAGDPVASDPIISALQDSDEQVRAVAARGLWDVIHAEECQPLLQFLNSPDPKVRAAIAGVLGKTRASQWVAQLAQALTDPSPHVRAAVVNALARIGPAAEPHLMAILERGEDTDPFVRARAAEAAYLISPGSAEAARRVFELCRDPEERVRESASVCLVGFARNGLADPLVELLADAECRGPALQVLAEADEAVLHQVLSHAQRAPSEIGRPAAEALSAVLRKRWTVKDLKPELASLETEVRLAGLEGLALIGGEEAVQEMVRLLVGDPARQVRLRAAHVLSAYVDDLSVLQALHRAEQSDPDPEVRRVAGEAEWSISLPPH